MEISLRKANALQLAIGEALKGLKLDTTLMLSIYEPDAEACIEQASLAWEKARSTRGRLYNALYEIRRKVGAANDAAGIDTHLTEIARLEKDAHFLGQMAAATPRESREVLAGRIQRLKTREDTPSPRYGSSQALQEVVSVSLFEADEIEVFTAELRQVKRRKQALQDTLLELNARTTITLSDEAETVLRSQDLL